jgi:arsenate reductase-like glutaredoxin family protein
MTCGRAREFLERHRIAVTAEVNAGRDKYGRAQALALARQAKRLIAARGTRIVEMDLTKKPSDADLLALLLGPTGNLRAPTLRVGSTLYVGFPKGGFEGLG